MKKVLLGFILLFSVLGFSQTDEMGVIYGTNKAAGIYYNYHNIKFDSKINEYIGGGFAVGLGENAIYDSSFYTNMGIKVNKIQIGSKFGISIMDSNNKLKGYILYGLESSINITKNFGISFGYNNIMNNTFGIYILTN